MIGWLGDKISDFGSGIVKGFKKVFYINSPSRVMRDSVGKYIAQGVGVGFTEELPEGGLGILLIQTAADSAVFCRTLFALKNFFQF